MADIRSHHSSYPAEASKKNTDLKPTSTFQGITTFKSELKMDTLPPFLSLFQRRSSVKLCVNQTNPDVKDARRNNL